MIKLLLTQKDCLMAAGHMAEHIAHNTTVPGGFGVYRMYGVPRGGIPVAYLLLSLMDNLLLVDKPEQADIIVDDIVDSGTTKIRYMEKYGKPFYALTDFMELPEPRPWVVFPWEQEQEGKDTSADDIVIRLLQHIGEDPTREGLIDTPKRVLKAWKEMTVGYSQDPAKILERDFPSKGYDEIVGCPWIEFNSTCEHHLLPFIGRAHVAYLPQENDARVVGLSKLARLVDCFAQRLQIQEQMTVQIADALETHLKPRGVAVVLQAKHLCMACRGVRKHQSVMVTSAMRGVFRTNAAARTEFFSLVELARHENGK